MSNHITSQIWQARAEILMAARRLERLRDAVSPPETGSATRGAGPDQATHTFTPQSCRSATKREAAAAEARHAIAYHEAEARHAEVNVRNTSENGSDSEVVFYWKGVAAAHRAAIEYLGVRLPVAQSDVEEAEEIRCPAGPDGRFQCEQFGHTQEWLCGACPDRGKRTERSGSRNASVEASPELKP